MIKKIYIAYTFIFLGFFFATAQGSYRTLVFEGNQQFEKGNFEGSSSKFMDAVKKNSKDFTAHYNLGNSLYKQKKYTEARAEYEKAVSMAKSKEDKSAALYNQGNAYMMEENAAKAAEMYKNALKQDPYNEAIRKNYEIAMLREKEKQQGKNGDKGGGGGENGKNKDKDSQKDPNGQKQEGGKGDQNKGQGHGKNPDPNRNENNGSTMPKDVQDAILNRIEGKEQETARKILNKNSYSMPQSNEKDW